MHALWIALHNSRSAPHDGSMHRAASHFHHENLHFTSYCAIVEINTVCITARRVLRWQWLTIAFFATWIVLRLVWNHCLAYYLHTIMLSQQSLPGSHAWCQEVGSCACVPVCACACVPVCACVPLCLDLLLQSLVQTLSAFRRKKRVGCHK